MSSRLLVALGCALLALVPGAALADQIEVGPRTTSGTILGPGNSANDSDSGSGFEHVESLAEVVETQDPNPYRWFASALVEGLSNLEVGTELNGGVNQNGGTRPRPACCVTGSSDAVATLEFSYTNPFDHDAAPNSTLTLPDAEVLFRLPSTLQPVADQDRGFFEAAIFAVGAVTPLFVYRLELVTTNGGFMEDPSTTSNVTVDVILNGSGGIWGYKTKGAEIPLDLGTYGPNETRAYRYVMRAHGENHFQQGEVGVGFSVKLGDPLTVGGAGGITVVPEPSAGVLLVAVLPALACLGVRRRWIAGIGAGLAVLLLLSASEARAQACGVVADVPSTFLDDYLETLGGLFPLSASDCEKITSSAVSTCHKAVSQSASCAESQIKAVRKGAKTGCKAQGTAEDACNADIGGVADLVQGLLDAQVDAANAECDASFANQLDLACRSGLDH